MCSPFHATKLTVSIAEKTMLCSQPHTGAPNLTVGTNTYLNSITTVETSRPQRLATGQAALPWRSLNLHRDAVPQVDAVFKAEPSLKLIEDRNMMASTFLLWFLVIASSYSEIVPSHFFSSLATASNVFCAKLPF